MGRPPAEAEIHDELVRRLLAAQFPQWARREIGARQVGKEHRWLPALAGRLPLAIPAVVGQGTPGEGYPWS